MTIVPSESDSSDAISRAYYVGFVAVLVACFSPFKVLAYMLPAAFVVWLLVRAKANVSQPKLFFVLYFYAFLGLCYRLALDEFLVSNYVLALVTYSAFIPIVVIDSRSLARPLLLRNMLRAVSGMLGFQGLYGIIQAVYGFTESGAFEGSNGDYVEGTIHPQLAAEYAFGNPMFAANVALMLIACVAIPQVLVGQRRTYAILGTTALVLASVVHVLVFLAAAVIAAVILIRFTGKKKVDAAVPKGSRRNLFVMLALAGALSYAVIPRNMSRVVDYALRLVDIEGVEVPRTIMLYSVFTTLPDAAPSQPWVGLGPGQFSSRASLLASGLFLGGPANPRSLPFMEPQATRLADDYCFSLLRAFSDNYDTFGATNQPFFSFLSIYTELGLVGLCVLLWMFLRAIRQVRQRARDEPAVALPAFSFCAGATFVLLLGLVENYWETPQAIFVGLLLLKVLYANVMYGQAPAATA